MLDRKEAFRLAIQNEIMSQILYAALSRSFRKNPAVAITFTHLIPMEALHEEKLRAAFAKEFPGTELKLDKKQSPSLKASELDDPKKVLSFAISRETAAHQLYLNMASESTDPTLVKLLNELAAEEDNHKTVLETEILRLEGLMTWFDPSELNGLMED